MFRAFAAARSSATIAAFGGEPKGGRGTGRCIVEAKASGGPRWEAAGLRTQEVGRVEAGSPM